MFESSINATSEHLDLDQLKELKYLEMCIKEALRLYPSVPFIGRELVEDTTISESFNAPRNLYQARYKTFVNMQMDTWFQRERHAASLPTSCTAMPKCFQIPKCTTRNDFRPKIVQVEVRLLTFLLVLDRETASDSVSHLWSSKSYWPTFCATFGSRPRNRATNCSSWESWCSGLRMGSKLFSHLDLHRPRILSK